MIFYKLRNIVAALLLLLNCIHTNAVPETKKIEKLTILVSSCDKYASLWDPFFASLFKQWPTLLTVNRHIPIMLIANNKHYPDPRVQMINISQETSWSDNMLLALEKINSKYVLLMLDDYWVINPVQEMQLDEILQIMQKEDIAMTQLTYNNPEFHYGVRHPKLKYAIYTNKYAQYKASLQVAIWDKHALQFLLRSGENPWEFEINGTKRSHGYPARFLNIEKNYPIEYLNATRQGHIEQAALDYVHQHHLPFKQGDLPVLDKYHLKLLKRDLHNKLKKLRSVLAAQ